MESQIENPEFTQSQRRFSYAEIEIFFRDFKT